jgi:hypothetical protein
MVMVFMPLAAKETPAALKLPVRVMVYSFLSSLALMAFSASVL